MGDSARFKVFANYIKINFPKVKSIADIAGGKGSLQVELRKFGYTVTTYDKRHIRINRNLSYKYAYFDNLVKDHYDLLVGMHPDEATDVIVTEAIKRNISFCVVPCCVIPCVIKYNGGSSYNSWVKHLKKIAESAKYEVSIHELPIKGKNIVLSGRPK